jgi:hypothetical protein
MGKRLAIAALTAILVMAGLRIAMTSAAVMEANTVCSGHNLVVDLNVASASTEYRLNGAGPSLPSDIQTGSEAYTFELQGPGTWDNLYAEYWSRMDHAWKISEFTVSPGSITCAAE